MIGRTHAIGGAALAAGTVAVTGNVEAVPLWGYVVAYAMALVPDMDQATSTAGRKWYNKPISLILRRFSHRGATHSITVGVPGCAAVMLAIWYLLNTYAATDIPLSIPIVATLGYASHIVLDMFNKQGVWLFYPFLRKSSGPGFKNGFFYLPLPRMFRIRTGGSKLGKNPTLIQKLRHNIFGHDYEKYVIRTPLKFAIGWVAIKNIEPVLNVARADWTNLLGIMPTELQPLAHFLLW